MSWAGDLHINSTGRVAEIAGRGCQYQDGDLYYPESQGEKAKVGADP